MEQGTSDSALQEKTLNFLKSNFLIVGVFIIGLILIAVGLIQIFSQRQASIKFEKGQDVSSASSAKIKVDIEGEVIRPGLYELSSDARVQDALIAAGGLTTNANRKAINLAAKIADGQKVYIPAEGEIAKSVAGVSDAGGVTGAISINSASESELDRLPGIGPVTAQKIIDGRPYGAVDELLNRKIVSKSTFEKIQDQISL